ncbi:uncharacterized protein LOC143037884 [Oratosquilla oratoria]|uniref:uncharacterized protein LOC143037884 n=1 Tax=Oratosquilla oratoria TaxID=337810 RepID=UPI003F7721C0
MIVFGCGLNTSGVLIPEGPSCLCCPVQLMKDKYVIDVQVAFSQAIWKLEGQKWFYSGHLGKQGERLSADLFGLDVVAASENRIVAVNKVGKLMLWREAAWKILSFPLGPLKHDVDEEHEEDEPRFITAAVQDNLLVSLDHKGQLYNSTVPLPINGVIVKHVAVGKEHCLALGECGTVFAWGSGMKGQVGNGSLCEVEEPTPVEALCGMNIIYIAAGGWHSAAISDSGDVYLWGWNECGQLGFPFMSTKELFDFKIYDNECQCNSNLEQNSHKPNCFPYVKNTQLTVVKGYNYENRHRININREREVVNVASTPALLDFWEEDVILKSVSCGDRHTIFQLDDGSVWGCGWNKYGQLGLGHKEQVLEPTECSIRNVTHIRAGAYSSFFFFTDPIS